MTAASNIRKVICPTDLSPAAQNATQYAGHFCKLIDAELELIYVNPIWKQLLLLNENSHPVIAKEPDDLINSEMKQLTIQLHNKFNINCIYDVVHPGSNIRDVIEAKSHPGALVIAGTTGSDKFIHRIFGSPTFRLTKALQVPVLVIPEHVEFQNVRQIIYAWDYHPHESCINCLETYAKATNSKLIFLHVSGRETEISKDVFRAVTGSMKRKLKGLVSTEFERVYAPRLRKGLNDYMKEHRGSILAVSYRNGNMLKKFFNRANNPEMSFQYPMLVIHGSR